MSSVGRRAAGVAGVVGVLLMATGCTSVSDDPVPTVADEPFVCDGVPTEGAALMTGQSDLERESSSGDWADPMDATVCNVESADGAGLLTVSQEPLDWHGAGDAEEYIAATVAGLEGAQEIEAAAEGLGYAYPEGEESVAAQWACGDLRLTVNVYRLAGGDRDPLTDVSRYVTSMLPWACEGADAPTRTRD